MARREDTSSGLLSRRENDRPLSGPSPPRLPVHGRRRMSTDVVWRYQLGRLTARFVLAILAGERDRTAVRRAEARRCRRQGTMQVKRVRLRPADKLEACV